MLLKRFDRIFIEFQSSHEMYVYHCAVSILKFNSSIASNVRNFNWKSSLFCLFLVTLQWAVRKFWSKFTLIWFIIFELNTNYSKKKRLVGVSRHIYLCISFCYLDTVLYLFRFYYFCMKIKRNGPKNIRINWPCIKTTANIQIFIQRHSIFFNYWIRARIVRGWWRKTKAKQNITEFMTKDAHFHFTADICMVNAMKEQ